MDLIRTSKKARRVVIILLYLAAALWILPFITLIKKTFLGGGFNNYIYVLTHKINSVYLPLTYLNSLIIGAFVCFLTLAIATCAGFGFSKLDIPFKNVIFNIIIIGLAIPAISVVIPLYFLYGNLHILNTRVSIIMTQITLFIPMSVIIMRNYFDSLPKALLEASRIDGATTFQSFFHVFLPLAKPVIANLGVLIVTWSFKDFLVPLIFITNPKLYPATVSVSVLTSDMSSSLTDIGRYNTALLLLSIPPLIIFIIGRKVFQSGMLSGSIKS